MLTEDYEEGLVKSYDLTHQGFKCNVQSIQVNSWPVIQLINGP